MSSVTVRELILLLASRPTLTHMVRELKLDADETSTQMMLRAVKKSSQSDEQLLRLLHRRELGAVAESAGISAAKYPENDALIRALISLRSFEEPKQTNASLRVNETPAAAYQPSRQSVDATSSSSRSEPIVLEPPPSLPGRKKAAVVTVEVAAEAPKKRKRQAKKAVEALQSAELFVDTLIAGSRLPGRETETFVAIDFETADPQRDSACSVALVRVEQNQVTSNLISLIKPPRKVFTNSGIHGIRWEHVKDAPSFADLYPSIVDFLKGADYLVAHNMGFDRSVLRACCEAAGLVMPTLPTECSMRMAKKLWELPSARLDLVCAKLNIPLKHHDAASDAEACAKVVIAARAEFASQIAKR